MQESQNSKTEQVVKELAAYINLRIDSLKLSMVENLSYVFSSILGLLLFVLLLSIAVLMLTAAFTFWLGMVVGSLMLAIVIVAMFYIIVAIVIFSLRHKLIADNMVRVFSRMFFTTDRPDRPDHLDRKNDHEYK